MMFEDGLIVALIVTGLMALFVLPAVRRAMTRALKTRPFKQSGNVFFMLFGAVAIAGLIGVSTMTTMKGPTRGITHSNQIAAANNALHTTARMIAGAYQAEADCDSDGIVEPPPWRDAGGLSAPSGGGLVPTDLGATQRDPWGSDIGYCAWDHGRRTVTHDVATCGGAGANRLVGVDSKSEYVIAVISAGPDRTFQTTCHPWVDADDDGVPDAPLIVTPAGSDDIVRAQAITALFAEGTTNQLQQLPDDACTPDAIGTLRYDAGTMQVCRDGGWQEVGSSIQVSGSFLPVTGAQLGSEHTTSNGISFTGFFGTRTASVDGGAILIVNGVEQGNTASIVAGDTIELKANAAGAPATTSTFTLSVSTLRRAWTITTRDPTPPALVMTPASNDAMNVTGPGSPAHGGAVRFTVRNSGETPTVALGAAQLSNTTNFAFDASGANVGDACQGQVLAHNATCFIDVRPRASVPGAFSGTLTVSDGTLSDDSALAGTATGWPCTVAANTTWTVGGSTCTVPTALNITDSNTGTATDFTSPTLGSATYLCNNGTPEIQGGATCITEDTTPNAFSFIDQTGVALDTTITSNTVTISGINTGTTVSVSGHTSARISINGGSWVTSGTISNNQTLRVRLTSANTNGASRSATVDVGGVTDNWSVSTAIDIVNNGSYRRWSDNTHARSCNEYRNPAAGYSYSGDTGSGTYRIDIDGAGSETPFNVYCDMTTSGGGWTRVIDGSGTTISQLNRFGNTSQISGTYETNSTYGVSWGTNNDTFVALVLDIPFSSYKITYSGMYTGGLGYLRVGTSEGNAAGIAFYDSWNSNSQGQSLAVNGSAVFTQSQTNVTNRTDTIDAQHRYFSMKGFTAGYNYSRRWINELWVK